MNKPFATIAVPTAVRLFPRKDDGLRWAKSEYNNRVLKRLREIAAAREAGKSGWELPSAYPPAVVFGTRRGTWSVERAYDRWQVERIA